MHMRVQKAPLRGRSCSDRHCARGMRDGAELCAPACCRPRIRHCRALNLRLHSRSLRRGSKICRAGPAPISPARWLRFAGRVPGVHCARADQPMASNGQYGGTVADWSQACAAADTVIPGGEHAFFESYFTPYEVRGQGEERLTAYFEPVVDARRAPEPGFTEPLLVKPPDMVTVDVGAFADAYDDKHAARRAAPADRPLVGAMVEPYPKRSAITAQPGQAFAYANPVDVYNLQVQGSGRLAFPDGTQERAAFAAQNGYRWTSALRRCGIRGNCPAARPGRISKPGRARAGDAATHSALNADPSYVFFSEEAIADPSAGPRGAAGVNLTPMASIAVDPAYHPYGAVIYVDGQYDNAPVRSFADCAGYRRRHPARTASGRRVHGFGQRGRR